MQNDVNGVMQVDVQWAPVIRFPHLLVSTKGEIYSTYVKRILKCPLTGIEGCEYKCFSYRSKENKVKHFKVHRIVAETFIENPLNLPSVNHKDGNKLNNQVYNLEWCSASENCIHAIDTGLNPKIGQLNHNSKFSNKNIAKVIEMYELGYTQKLMSSVLKVNQSTISRIINRLTYKKIKL